MKFYDIDALENKCGIHNKYKITALVAARARWLSEQKTILDSEPANEKYLSAALLEVENGEIPSAWLKELERADFSKNSQNPKNACVETLP